MKYVLSTALISLIGVLAITPAVQAEGDYGTMTPCGQDNQRSIWHETVPTEWLDTGDPVARILFPDGGCCTGFLISENCLVTAAHCFNSYHGYCGESWPKIQFRYEDESGQRTGSACDIQSVCTPEEWHCDGWDQIRCGGVPIDVVVVSIPNQEIDGGWTSPGFRYGVVSVGLLGPEPPSEGMPVHAIGHPDGRCKEYSNDSDALVREVGGASCDQPPDWPGACMFAHDADTEVGSSGGPIYDDMGNVVGIVVGAPPQRPPCYCAVRIDAVWQALLDICNQGPTARRTKSWGAVKSLYR